MSQEESQEENGATVEVPSPHAWIRCGIDLIVTDGNKNTPYAAKSISDPFMCDNEWYVRIKYDVECSRCDVECSRCSEIKFEESGVDRARLRHRRSEKKKEEKRPKVKVEKRRKNKLEKRRRVEAVEKRVQRPPTVIDLSSSGDEAQSLASFSVPDVDGFCEPASDSEDIAPLSAAARMPLPGEYDGDDDEDDMFAEFQLEAKSGSVAQVSDELNDESDEESDMNTKPRARTSSRDKDAEKLEKRRIQFEAAEKALGNLSFSAKELETALHKIGPPYTQLNAATLEIQRKRKEDAEGNGTSEVFDVVDGMEIRKPFEGKMFKGRVIFKVEEETKRDGKVIDVWKVLYEDGDEEDLEYDELLRHRWPPPKVAECRGRPMQCLELFCGRGIVSQEFRLLKWKAISLDIDVNSNATMVEDILNIEPEDLAFVPDFMWASLPCHTYSRAAGAKHRCAKKGDYEKTQEACDNNFLFTKMVEIMNWAKQKHPHCIVAIENPVGQLAFMPLMQKFEEEFKLQKVVVDYCAFGRSEQKPTIIWTNDFSLRDALVGFTCKERCCMGGTGNHESVQANRNKIDYSVIPQPLAEEVAERVSAKFNHDRIRRTQAASPRG